MSIDTKRSMDKKTLKEVFLDDLVDELRRRGCQVMYGNGVGLRGRVIFVPQSVEVMRAENEKRQRREETRGGDASEFETLETSVGVPPQRQGVHSLYSKRPNAREERESFGSRFDRESESSVGMQRSSRWVHSISEAENTSVI